MAGDGAEAKVRARALWALGVFALVASLSVRAVEPALPGLWTGADRIIDGLRGVGATLSQLFGAGGAIAATAAAFGMSRTEPRRTVRALGIGTAAMLAFAVLIGSGALSLSARILLGERVSLSLPLGSELVLAITVSAFALCVAWSKARRPNWRAGAIALGLGAATAIARAAVAALLSFNGAERQPILAARTAATFAWLAEAGVVAAAIAWFATARATGPSSETTWRKHLAGALSLLLAVGIAAAGCALAIAGQRSDAPRLAVLVSRAAEQLLDPLPPYVGSSWRAAVELLRWGTAAVGLAVVPRGVPKSSAVCLALIGAGEAFTPLGALALGLAAYLAASDDGPDDRTDDRPILAPRQPAD